MKTKLRLHHCGLIIICSGIFCGGRAALAQSSTVGPVSCEQVQECTRLANEAREHSQAGRFMAAKRAYEAAYARQPDPKLLFNLARVLHKADIPSDAAVYYRRYLDAGADNSVEQRSKAQQFLDQAIREQSVREPSVRGDGTTPNPSVQQASSATTVPSDPRESSQTVPVYRKWWLWTSIGVLSTGIAVGIGLGMAVRRPDLTGAAEVRPFGN